MGWPHSKGNAQASPSISAREQGFLDALRLTQASGGDKGKGHGKGGGKTGKSGGGKAGGKGNGPAAEDRTCQREGCRAAHNRQATWGGAMACHCCGLSLTATVPVQQLVGWAWDKRLQAQADKAQGKAAGAAAQPKAAAAAAGSAPKATPSAEELLALRNERLTLLKSAAATGKVEVAPPTALQEVTRVFLDVAQPGVKVKIEPSTHENTKELDDKVKAALASLKEETLPAEAALKTPSEIVNAMLAKPTKALQGKSEAEQALQTTRSGLASLRSCGTPESDEVILLMVARESRQAKELQLLDDKTPSQEQRECNLIAARADYAKELSRRADARTLGASKAAERAAARLKVAEFVLEAAQHLKEVLQTHHDELQHAHGQLATLKREQGAAVLALLDEKLEDLQSEDVYFEEFEDAEEPAPTVTKTENERDEARRLSLLLEAQLNRLQQAATAAEANAADAAPVGQNAAAATNLWSDLHISFQADPDQLPKPETVQGELLEAAARLHALLQAVPWGCALPAVQFHNLEMKPAGLHSLVGDTIWQACWRDRHHAITPQHAVPYQLLNIAKTVVERLSLTVSDAHRAAGNTLYKAAVQQSENRRAAGGPY